MKTLVTGATGFIGSAVTRALLEAGHDVRVLVRPDSPPDNLRGLPVELVQGDLGDAASLRRAVSGCQALFHLAACYRLWSRDPGLLYAVNVAGTRELMLAALDAGVGRVVYTSSVATIGLAGDGTPATEETPLSAVDLVGDYKRSKYFAEAEVRQLVAREGLPAVIVNPAAPVGPGDIRPTPTGRMVLDAVTGRMPAYVDTGLNIVHVDDVALGHLQAFEHGRVGDRYILGGTNMTLKDILQRVARLAGRPPPRVRLPHGLIMPFAYLSEYSAWLLRTGEPRLTVSGVRMARKYMYFSSDKARRELGYAPRSAELALRDAVKWFMSHGQRLQRRRA